MGLLKRVHRAITDDQLTLVSAGIAFYLFLSLFPALFAAVSIYGLVADPSTVAEQVERMAGVVPPSALEVIDEQLDEIVSDKPETLGWGAALAILLALWSARKGTRAMIKGLNIAYHEDERRNFFKVQAVALALTLGFMLFLFVSLVMIAIVPGLIKQLPLGFAAVVAAEVGKWTLLLALILGALALVYRYAPCILPPRWRWIAPGSITAAVLWLIASGLFSWFAANFADFNETYGILAAGVVILLWFQISVFVILLGAEINHELEQASSDTGDPWAETNAR